MKILFTYKKMVYYFTIKHKTNNSKQKKTDKCKLHY